MLRSFKPAILSFPRDINDLLSCSYRGPQRMAFLLLHSAAEACVIIMGALYTVSICYKCMRNKVCHHPHSISVALLGSPATCTGSGLVAVLPIPSCPNAFQPHVNTWPSAVRAALCLDPAEICKTQVMLQQQSFCRKVIDVAGMDHAKTENQNLKI